MSVPAKSWETTFRDYQILELNFSEPCLNLSKVHILSQNWPLGQLSLLSAMSICLSVCVRHGKTATSELAYCGPAYCGPAYCGYVFLFFFMFIFPVLALVLLSVLVKRFSVSRMRDFSFMVSIVSLNFWISSGMTNILM